MACEATMSKDVQPLYEDADETLLSQASQISDPEQEVRIWCDEKEIQNEKRRAPNDTLGNLTSGRFSPILSTLNASWDDISSTQEKNYIRKAREAVAATLNKQSSEKELIKETLIISYATFDNHSCIKMLHLEQKLLSLTLVNALSFRLLCGP